MSLLVGRRKLWPGQTVRPILKTLTCYRGADRVRNSVIDPDESSASSRPVETYVDVPESLRNIGKKPVELNRPAKGMSNADAEGEVADIRAKHAAEKQSTV